VVPVPPIHIAAHVYVRGHQCRARGGSLAHSGRSLDDAIVGAEELGQATDAPDNALGVWLVQLPSPGEGKGDGDMKACKGRKMAPGTAQRTCVLLFVLAVACVPAPVAAWQEWDFYNINVTDWDPGARRGHSMHLWNNSIYLFGGRANDAMREHVPKTCVGVGCLEGDWFGFMVFVCCLVDGVANGTGVLWSIGTKL